MVCGTVLPDPDEQLDESSYMLRDKSAYTLHEQYFTNNPVVRVPYILCLDAKVQKNAVARGSKSPSVAEQYMRHLFSFHWWTEKKKKTSYILIKCSIQIKLTSVFMYVYVLFYRALCNSPTLFHRHKIALKGGRDILFYHVLYNKEKT